VLHSGFRSGLSQDTSSGDLTTAESEQYFIYTNVMDQVLVFRRSLSDLTPSSVQMVKVLSGAKAGLGKVPTERNRDKGSSSNFKSATLGPEEILRKSREMHSSSASKMARRGNLAGNDKAFRANNEAINEEVDDVDAQMNDSADEGNISNGNGEQIVSTILAGEDEMTTTNDEEAQVERKYK